MTIVHIAKLANVSIGTVDRVIHNRGEVSLETKERVIKIINDVDYRPNVLARYLKRNKVYKIFLVIPQLNSESGYWNLINKGMQKATSELKIFFRVEVLEFNRYDKKSFMQCIQKAKNASADGLIVAPILQDIAIELLSNVDCPFVFVDTKVRVSLPRLVSVISQNPSKSGYTAAKVMRLLVPPTKDLVVVSPLTNAFNISQRIEGFMQFYNDISDYSNRPNIKTYNFLANESTKDFNVFMEKILYDVSNLGGIVCVTSAVHYIGAYLKQRNIKQEYAVVGYDLVEENIRGLEEGCIDCLISQAPEQQGYEGCYALYRKIVLEADDEVERIIPIDIIFKENLCVEDA